MKWRDRIPAFVAKLKKLNRDGFKARQMRLFLMNPCTEEPTAKLADELGSKILQRDVIDDLAKGSLKL